MEYNIPPPFDLQHQEITKQQHKQEIEASTRNTKKINKRMQTKYKTKEKHYDVEYNIFPSFDFQHHEEKKNIGKLKQRQETHTHKDKEENLEERKTMAWSSVFSLP